MRKSNRAKAKDKTKVEAQERQRRRTDSESGDGRVEGLAQGSGLAQGHCATSAGGEEGEGLCRPSDDGQKGSETSLPSSSSSSSNNNNNNNNNNNHVNARGSGGDLDEKAMADVSQPHLTYPINLINKPYINPSYRPNNYLQRKHPSNLTELF